jgi:hypothetical protein
LVLQLLFGHRLLPRLGGGDKPTGTHRVTLGLLLVFGDFISR